MLEYSNATGHLRFYDEANGQLMFDTGQGLLYVNPPDQFFSSIAVPNRTAYSSGVDGNQIPVDVQDDYFVGAVSNFGARVVRGLVRTAWASNPEPVDNLWRQVSGTHIDVYDGVSQTMKPQSDTGGFMRIATIGGYTFLVNDLNHCIMRERLVARARDPGGPPAQFSRVRQACTVSYRLLVGSFFGGNFAPRPGLALRGGVAWNMSLNTSLNVPTGYTYPGRTLYLLVHTNTNPPASVTLGGTACTLVASTGAGSVVCSLWRVAQATAGTLTVALTGSFTEYDVRIFASANMVSHTPTIVTASGTGTTLALPAMTVGASSRALVMCTLSNATLGLAPTWGAGVAPIYSGTRGNGIYSAVGMIEPGAGTVTPTITWPASGAMKLLGAVWT